MNGLENTPKSASCVSNSVTQRPVKNLLKTIQNMSGDEHEEPRREGIGRIDIAQLIESTARAVLGAAERVRQENAEVQEAQAVRHVDYRDVGGQIPVYGKNTDDDVEVWLARVDEIKKAYEVSDPIIKVLATKQLNGRARDWYDYTEGTIAMEWEELKIAMTRMFASHESHVSLIRKMESRVWKPGEKFSTYLFDKLKLMNKLRLQEQDKIQYIIQGVHDYVLKTQLLASKSNTVNELLELATLITEDQCKRAPRGGATDLPNSLPRRPQGPPSSVQQTRPQTSRNSTIKCFNCNEDGHISINCLKPR